MNQGHRIVGTAVAAATMGLVGVPASQAAVARRPVAAATAQTTEGAVDQGKVSSSAPVSVRVYLAPAGGEAALKAAVAAVSDPDSASYGKFLTPSQFRAAYQPTTATIAAVKTWLTANGLAVTSVESAARYISATGAADVAQKAFGTSLHTFTADGSTFQAPSGTVSVPESIGSSVLAISGLSTKPHRMVHQASYPDAFVNGKPCSIAYGSVAAKYQADFKTPLPQFGGKTLPYSVCGYTGPQFRAAYTGNSALAGAGATVAITDAYAASTIIPDITKYANDHGDGGYAPGQFVQKNAPKFADGTPDVCDQTGWYGEETLDIEAVHAIAPLANIRYYGGRSCSDADFGDLLLRVVDDNKASIVTNSWADYEQNETPDGVVAYEQAFQQGALQGISFMFSSGDNGDEVANTGIKQTDYPSSDPYVTSVGGTSTAIDASGSIAFQTGWGTNKFSLGATGKTWDPVGYLYGAGGGYSALFNRPSYQAGIVPVVGSSGSARAVPDVAMDADPTTGMLVGETQLFPGGPAYGEYRIGGTSLASPLMAGMQALTVGRTGKRQGFLNPSIYKAAAKTPSQFLDVKGAPADAANVRADYANGLNATDGMVYSVRTFNQNSSLNGDGAVKPGWDETTGIGVPSPAYLAGFGG